MPTVSTPQQNRLLRLTKHPWRDDGSRQCCAGLLEDRPPAGGGDNGPGAVLQRKPGEEMRYTVFVFTFALLAALEVPSVRTDAAGNETRPPPSTTILQSTRNYATLLDRLREAVTNNGMAIVAEASASKGAATRGIEIPGNAVVMVFRNDFAVRMLAASVPAGIEAPLRFYVTENDNGTATLTYQIPSAVFAPYGNADLDALAQELDAIFAKIAQEAVR